MSVEEFTKQLQQILNLITTDKELNTYFQDKLMSAMRIRVGIFVP